MRSTIDITVETLNQPTDAVRLKIGDHTVAIPATTVAAALLQTGFRDSVAPAESEQSPAPRVGEVWLAQGGYYAGIARGREGSPDHHLIVYDTPAVEINWPDANAWAAGLTAAGHHDLRLPTRQELALLFANVAELFERDWYWSAKQYAADAEYAWGQDFSTGYQLNGRKSTALRARAVRSVAIE